MAWLKKLQMLRDRVWWGICVRPGMGPIRDTSSGIVAQSAKREPCILRVSEVLSCTGC
jgi:hypothetical protein